MIWILQQQNSVTKKWMDVNEYSSAQAAENSFNDTLNSTSAKYGHVFRVVEQSVLCTPTEAKGN